MVTVAWALGLLAGTALVVVVGRSRTDTVTAAIAGLGYAGAYLTFMSFLACPWLLPAPPSTFMNNLDWLARHLAVLNLLQGLLAVDKVFPFLGSADSFHSFLENSEAGPFLHYVTSGRPLFGWQLWQLSWSTNLALSLGLTLALLAGFGSIVLFIVLMITGSRLLSKISIIVGICSIIALFLLIAHVATIDTLGSSMHFLIRLVAALAQVRLGPGVWWMLLGLVTISGFCTTCYLYTY